MPPQELPPQIGEMMLRRGAVVVFGPDYLENSLLMLRHLENGLAGKAVLSCEKIDDLTVPEGPALNCVMIFFHRAPSHTTLADWEAALLKGVALRSQPPKGLGVEDASPEDPRIEFAPAAGERDMQLILTWTRPLEARHLVETARAIERSYLKNGGRYTTPGVMQRLRSLFSRAG